jgi:hypothetical protein
MNHTILSTLTKPRTTLNAQSLKRKCGALALLSLFFFSTHSYGRGNVEHAFYKGAVTTYVGLGAPNWFGALSELTGGSSFGPILIGGQYHVTNNFSIGLQYGNSSVKGGDKIYDDGTTSFSYKYKLAVSSVTLAADYYWLNRKFIALYSGINVGYLSVKASTTFADNIDRSNLVSFNAKGSGVGVTNYKLIGAKAIIAKNFGLFGTFGVGTEGIVGFGLNYTFMNDKHDSKK